MFSRMELDSLMTADVPVAVSIYLPTHVKGREIRQDSIRLKNLADEAEAKLIEHGLRRPEAEEVLAPARALVGKEEFWRYQDLGLALFLAPGFSAIHQVPAVVPEMVMVGHRFHVRPLLPVLAFDGQFFLLTVTARQARLFHGTKHRLAEIDLPQMPQSIAEVQEESDYQNMRHSPPVARPHSGQPGGVPTTHNFGETPEEMRKTQLIEHLNRIDAALKEFFGGEQSPLVLAAEPEIDGHFRSVSELRNLLPDGIQANPEALSTEELHARAYAIVRPGFEEGLRSALAHFKSLSGNANPKASTRPDEILKGANDSRVDALFLSDDAALWGRVTDQGELTAAHTEPRSDDEDLADFAAVQTLQHGGVVYHVTPQELPPGTAMAAVFRW